MMMKKLFNYTFAFLLLTPALFGQGFTNYLWYFGNSEQGINFSKFDQSAELIDGQAIPFDTKAAAIANDPTSGDLLFYTDGTNVYDRTHQAMPNGAAINGQLPDPSANQSLAIVPVPGSSTTYFIFKNSAVGNSPGQIRIGQVDMSQQGNSADPSLPFGDFTTFTDPGIVNTSEAMAIIGFEDLVWLVVQEINTSIFHVYEVTANGAENVQSFDLSGSFSPFQAANFSFHMASGRMAVAPQDQNKNVIILDFNIGTGALSFNQEIAGTGNADFATEAIYDTEWSADGSKLYISRHGGNGSVANVMQYSIADDQLNNVLNNAIFRSYGLQMGPDNRIYHLYQSTNGGPFEVGVMNNPDSLISSVGYTSGLFNGNDMLARQFPQVALPMMVANNLTFDYTGECQNNSTEFHPLFSPQAEFYNWDFGDGNGSNHQSPIHTYESPGQYQVSLTAMINGQVDTVQQIITIQQNDLAVNLGPDTVICENETLTLDAGTGIAYQWSTGETTQTIEVNEAGYYWVVVTDAGNCPGYDGVNVDVYGQENQTANVWYFGTNAGIDFNEIPAVALSDGAMDAPEGCAVICDRNGDVLFYTDGQTVYNANHVIMDEGTDIGGDPTAAQSSLIVPFPEDETKFYIFTASEVYGDYSFQMNYSVVDLKEGGGLGSVVRKNVPLFVNSTERVTAANSWVVAHEFGNNTFRAYNINTGGIATPILSNIGSVHDISSAASGQGTMKLSLDGSRLAVALSGGENVVELFDFVDSTGQVTNFLQLDLEDLDGTVYGIEFSATGENLFVSLYGGPDGNSKIYSYEVDTTDTQYIIDSRTLVTDINQELGSLQIGPDGQIYVAVNGASQLGVISDPDGSPTFILNGSVTLSGTSTLGLPNFVQSSLNSFGEPGMQVLGNCVGSEAQFFATPTSSIDEFAWSIENANNQAVFTSFDQNPTHTFTEPGIFTVNLTISNRCGFFANFTEDLEIFAPPADPDLPGAIALCGDSVTLDAGAQPNVSYLWSTGETTQAITVGQANFTYSVTITNENGCTSEGEVFVGDLNPEVDLGPDLNLCIGDQAELNAGNGGADFTWTVNGQNTGNTARIQSIDTSTPGTFTYAVTVLDAINGQCSTTDSMSVTIANDFVAIQDNNNTQAADCSINADGTLAVVMNPAGDYDLSWFNSSNVQVGSGTSVIGPGGIYRLDASDNASGCSNSFFFTMEDNGATHGLTVDPIDSTCVDVAATVNITNVVDPFYSYRIVNTQTNAIADENAGFGNSFNSQSLAPGDYLIEVTVAGCVETASIEVPPNETVQFTVPSAVDGCNSALVQAQTNQDLTFTWSGPGINGFIESDQLSVTQPGTNSYTVVVTDNGGVMCDSTAQVIVSVASVPEVTVAKSGPDGCEDGVILTAVHTNNISNTLIYQWNNGMVGKSIEVFDNGTYSVLVRDSTVISCTQTDDIEVTEIDDSEPVLVTLILEPQCDLSQPVTLQSSTNKEDVFYTWYLDGNNYRDGRIAEQFNTSSLEIFEEGEWSILVTDQRGCEATAEMLVDRDTLQASELAEIAYICPFDPDTVLTLSPGQYNAYTWSLNGSFLSNEAMVETTEPGRYIVVVENLLQCELSDTIDVIEYCPERVMAPTAFTPDGDGLNDEYVVFTEYVGEFEILIYNRWGELIRKFNSKEFTWDGTTKAGGQVPVGTYTYLIRYKSEFDPDKGQLEQRGGIMVIR